MGFKTLSILACAVLAAAPAGAQSVSKGIDAWRKGDHAAAVRIWRPLAENGDADAAFNLGQAYRLGRGIRIDLDAARKWLTRAADAGHLDAQATLGLLLFNSGDRPAGIGWLKTAAERGELRAMLIYGTALFNGDSVKRDPALGYAYASRAAAGGLAAARGTLADMDKLIPAADRKKALAMAADMAPPVRAAAKPAAKAPVQPKAKAPAATATVKLPPAAGSATGGWRIQLGAFSKRSSAEALFARLSGRAPVAGKQPFLVRAGAVTRLQVGPYPSRAAAAAACAALAGQPCFPVAAR